MFGFIDKKTVWVAGIFMGVVLLILISIQISNGDDEKCLENVNTEILTAYSQYNNALTAEHSTLSTLEVIKKNQSKIDKEAFTQMIYSYESLLESQKSKFNNDIFSPKSSEALYAVFPQTYSSEAINEIENETLNETLKTFVSSGYKLCRSESGMYKICIDYSFFEQFESNITEEAKMYFHIMKKEQAQLVFGKTEIYVTAIELSQHLEGLYDFISMYPKSVRRESINKRANKYLLALLFGYGNSWPRSDETQVALKSYKDAYRYLVENSHGELKDIFSGLLTALKESDDIWTESVFDYVYDYPEIFRKEHLGISIYEDAFIDVVYGHFASGSVYYYPVISGIDSTVELGRINSMIRGVIEKYMLGEGFDGMYGTNVFMWSDFQLTFHRQNIISIKYSIYTEKHDGSSYWKYEGFNYDFKKKRRIQLDDILKNPEDRQKINTYVEQFLSKSRTYYAISLEDFYKNPHPDFYIGDYGITLLIPQDLSAETLERNVEIFIPFEKFSTNVEHIYKIPIE